MISRLWDRFSYANVAATLALVIAIGGGTFAVAAPNNSINSQDIINGAIKGVDVAGKLKADKCPKQTSEVEGVCVEKGLRGPHDWWDAGAYCRFEGRRLAGVDELSTLVAQGKMDGESEWAIDSLGVDGRSGVLLAMVVGPYGGFLVRDSHDTEYHYRCVTEVK